MVINLPHGNPRGADLPYRYYVAFGITGPGGAGFASVQIGRSAPVRTMADVESFVDLVRPSLPKGTTGATVLNFQLLSGPTTDPAPETDL